jgi:ABC-type nickel/cobalt efflux system permease component RcnA
MRLRVGLVLLALALAALGALWATGGLAVLGWRVAALQRELQALLADEIRALRSGEPGALAGLLAACAAYGFLHAAGPGHGKALVAGAALGLRATARRMALIALAGSLGQALVAIALVYGAFALFDATARALTEDGERWFAAAGNLAIVLVGTWLVARGLAALPRAAAAHAGHHDDGCGHAHGPDPEAVARAVGPGATLGLVAAIAARPCTGAIFVLAIAWRLGAPAAGALAVVAMGLGTAAFTAIVAWFATSGREAALAGAGSGGVARLVGPGLQIAAGVLVAALGGLALLGALAT